MYAYMLYMYVYKVYVYVYKVIYMYQYLGK